MGLVLCKCFAAECQAGCTPTGYGLVRMRPPEGCPPTTIYDLDTGKSYPWNWTQAFPIDEDGCWRTCELPFSDRLSPNITYEIVDIISGSCGDDCGCDAGAACGCPTPCNDELPYCELWLDSTQAYAIDEDGCVNAGLLCTGGGMPPTTILPCKDPTTISVPFSELCVADGASEAIGVWYAVNEGTMTIETVSIPVGVDPSASDIFFEMVKFPDNEVVASGMLPAGQSASVLNHEFHVPQGCGIGMRIMEPSPDDMCGVFTVQTQFSYCPQDVA